MSGTTPAAPGEMEPLAPGTTDRGGLTDTQIEILEQFAEAQGKSSQAGVEADVLEQPGVKDAPKPGGKPQPEHFEVGNFGHKYAEQLIPESQMPRGLDDEVTVKLPDGGEVRVDRVRHGTGRAEG